jgi:hypothetical protein
MLITKNVEQFFNTGNSLDQSISDDDRISLGKEIMALTGEAHSRMIQMYQTKICQYEEVIARGFPALDFREAAYQLVSNLVDI